eukprot:SAG11_NODE_2087_length_3845_cov_5.794447_3_plen_39_part_00
MNKLMMSSTCFGSFPDQAVKVIFFQKSRPDKDLVPSLK